MVMKITDISATRCGVLVTAISTTLFLSLPASTDARKPQLLDTKIMRGKTATGFHYMTGGLAFDEQRTMERQSAPYNPKLVFYRARASLSRRLSFGLETTRAVGSRKSGCAPRGFTFGFRPVGIRSWRASKTRSCSSGTFISAKTGGRPILCAETYESQQN
jgi:hypothetical protein